MLSYLTGRLAKHAEGQTTAYTTRASDTARSVAARAFASMTRSRNSVTLAYASMGWASSPALSAPQLFSASMGSVNTTARSAVEERSASTARTSGIANRAVGRACVYTTRGFDAASYAALNIAASMAGEKVTARNAAELASMAS